MRNQNALTVIDIGWLRRASHKAGVVEVPVSVASRLLTGGLVQSNGTPECLMITAKGRLALERLG